MNNSIECTSLVRTWTPLQFLALLGFPLVLFVAAALVLPLTELQSGDTLAASFERDGRWALLFLSVYFFLAVGHKLVFLACFAVYLSRSH